MRKKVSLLIVASMFLLLLVPTISMAEIDKDVMTAGDTFIYSVAEFDVPWADLFENGDSMGFPIEDLVIDLADSTFGVKVMGTDDNDGYYMLSAYVILGRTIEIPIPEEQLTPEIEEILGGNKISIPKGIGIGVPANIPGSDYLEFIDNDYEDFPGLPFYFDANEWNQYDDMFEDLEDMLDDADTGIDITYGEEDDEYVVTLEGSFPGSGAEAEYTTTDPYEYTTTEYPLPIGGPEIDGDFTFEAAWHRSGKYAGVFKRVKANFDGDIGDANNVEINVEVEFQGKRHNPLPKAIRDKDEITLEMESATFDHEIDGFFEDMEGYLDQLEEVADMMDDAEGEDIFVFDIQKVEGCYYETDIEIYEADETVEGIWWNGFIGAAGWHDEYANDPWDNWYIYQAGGTPLVIPMVAPGITPDWDMWTASTKTVSSILEFVESAVTSSDAEDALADIGFTISEFDMQYEMRGNDDYKFFYFTGDYELNVDTEDIPEEDWPLAPDPERPKADIKVNFEVWLGYTTEGLILSIGVNLNVEASFEDFPYGSEYNDVTYEDETLYGDGSVNMEVNAEIRNTHESIKEYPDPTALPEDTEGEDGDGDGGLPTPGFSIIPALILIAAISVIIKRRK